MASSVDWLDTTFCGIWSGPTVCSGLSEEVCGTTPPPIPGDLVWDLPCMQQATWKGAHWCCPCTCTLIKNPMIMMISVPVFRVTMATNENIIILKQMFVSFIFVPTDTNFAGNFSNKKHNQNAGETEYVVGKKSKTTSFLLPDLNY